MAENAVQLVCFTYCHLQKNVSKFCPKWAFFWAERSKAAYTWWRDQKKKFVCVSACLCVCVFTLSLLKEWMSLLEILKGVEINDSKTKFVFAPNRSAGCEEKKTGISHAESMAHLRHQRVVIDGSIPYHAHFLASESNVVLARRNEHEHWIGSSLGAGIEALRVTHCATIDAYNICYCVPDWVSRKTKHIFPVD